jgi:hypothetical protein
VPWILSVTVTCALLLLRFASLVELSACAVATSGPCIEIPEFFDKPAAIVTLAVLPASTVPRLQET